MQLINRYNKGIRSFISAINVFSTYARVASLKGRKSEKVTKGFQTFNTNSDCKPINVVDFTKDQWNYSYKITI